MEEEMASKSERLTVWYTEMDGGDSALVGRRNAELGEMIEAGFPVPSGFAVTTHAMDRFVADSGIVVQLTRPAKENDEASCEPAKSLSDAAMRLIETAQLSPDLRDAIVSDYRRLCQETGIPDCPVVVAPSPAVSIPGKTTPYFNVRGEKDLIDRIRKCWSSAYTAEAAMDRIDLGAPSVLGIGISVCRMVNPSASGTIFTINPINGDPSKIAIDASYGLREAMASGLVTPDTYLIDKIVMEPVKTVIGAKEMEFRRSAGGSDIIRLTVAEERRHAPCLTRGETLELARIGRLIEDHYRKACDIEFGIDPDLPFPENIKIFRVRPESIWSNREEVPRTEKRKDAMDRLVGQLIAGVKLEKVLPENVHRPSLEGHIGCCPLCTLRSLGR
jgi:pyruvate, water dikinase